MHTSAIWALWKLVAGKLGKIRIQSTTESVLNLHSGFYPGHYGCYFIYTLSSVLFLREKIFKQAINLCRLGLQVCLTFCQWKFKSQFILLASKFVLCMWVQGPPWDLWGIHTHTSTSTSTSSYTYIYEYKEGFVWPSSFQDLLPSLSRDGCCLLLPLVPPTRKLMVGFPLQF